MFTNFSKSPEVLESLEFQKLIVSVKVFPLQVACTEPMGASSEFPSAKSTTALTHQPRAKLAAESKGTVSGVDTNHSHCSGLSTGKVRSMLVPIMHDLQPHILEPRKLFF